MKIRKNTTAKGYLHTLVTIVSAVLVIAGVGLGVWFYFFYRSHEETNDAQVEQYVTPVQARISGYVSEVRYIENQLVHKGDTLIVIDNREYKAKLDKALADELTANSAIAAANKNVAVAGSRNAVEKERLLGAAAAMVEAKQQLERYNALYAEQATTLQQVQKVKAAYETAHSHYYEIKNMITSASLTTDEAQAQVPAVQAVLMAKKAEAENAALFFSYTVVTAPYDGYVGKRTIQPGQLVKEGQTLVSIVSKEKWIIANFKETQLEYLQAGQQVEVEVDADSKNTYMGSIESLSPASGARFSLLPPDNATGNFIKIEQRIPVKIVLNGTAEETSFLRAGMNVTVTAAHKD